MDLNILEFAVLFQNITLELHHSKHYNHLDSSLSTQFVFTFKLGNCVKCGYISVQAVICLYFLCRYTHSGFTLLKTSAADLLPS